MKSILRAMLIVAVLLTSTVAMAASRDVRDGNVQVEPAKGDRYLIGGTTMGKAALFGYVSDLKDQETFSGIVLRKNDKATDEQRKSIASIAKTLELKAFTEERGTLTPIDD